MKETLDRKPAYLAQNTINFLNTLFGEEIKTMGIKYMIAVVTQERKVIMKHYHIEIF